MMRWKLQLAMVLLPGILSCRGLGPANSEPFADTVGREQSRCNPGPLPPSGTGRTLHLARTGDDQKADGSLARPFASLKRASDNARPGDTVLVHAGVYPLTSEQFLTARGTEDAWITFKAATGESVVFDAATAQLPDLYRGIITFGGAYVIFEGFELRNSPGSGLKFYQAHHIMLRNNLVHHIQGLAIGGSGDSITIEGNEVHSAVLSNENGKADRGGGWLPAVASGHWDSPLKRSRDWLVSGNYFHESWGECLDALYLEESVFRNNRIHDCYSTNIYLDNASRIQVLDNLSYVTDDRFNTKVNPHRAHGITFAAESRDGDFGSIMDAITIQGNRISGTHNGILYFDTRDGGYRDITIVGNTIWNQRREAVWIAPSGRAQGVNRMSDNLLSRGIETGSFGLGNTGLWTVSGNVETRATPPNLDEATCAKP